MSVICKNAEVCKPHIKCFHAEPHEESMIKYTSDGGGVYCKTVEFCPTAKEEVWCNEVEGEEE